MTKFDHDDDRRRMTPADPWLETAPTSPLDLPATADTRTSQEPPQPYPSVIDDDVAPRRGRRGWLWALVALVLLACAGLLYPWGGGDDPDAGGPTTEPTFTATKATGPAAPPTREEEARAAEKEEAAQKAAGKEVIYVVTADGTANIGNIQFTDADGEIIRLSGVRLPWRKTFRITGQRHPLVLDAQRRKGGSAGEVSCSITVAGRTISSTTQEGRYAAPECVG